MLLNKKIRRNNTLSIISTLVDYALKILPILISVSDIYLFVPEERQSEKESLILELYRIYGRENLTLN